MPRIATVMLACLMMAVQAAAATTAAEPRPAGPLPPPPPSHPISIERPWARPTSRAGGNAAVYLTIVNRGAEPDQLLGAETPIAARTGVHATTMHGDMAQMREAPVIPIPASGRTVLRPGSFHIMLMDLKRPLENAATFPLVLVFKRAGRVTTQVSVRNDEQGSFWGLPQNKPDKEPKWGAASPKSKKDGGHGKASLGSLL